MIEFEGLPFVYSQRVDEEFDYCMEVHAGYEDAVTICFSQKELTAMLTAVREAKTLAMKKELDAVREAKADD